MVRPVTSTRIASFVTRSAAGAAALGLVVGLAPAAPARADTGAALSRTVSFGDLNFQRHQGIERLYARIRGAAKDVCRPAEGKSLKQRAQWSACFERAVGNAVAEVDLPNLTEHHIARTRKSSAAKKLGKRD